MADQRDLSAAQRQRNVERVRAVETQLGQAETDLELVVFNAVRVHRKVRWLRAELRDVFGMESLGPLAPLYRALEEEADRRETPGGD